MLVHNVREDGCSSYVRLGYWLCEFKHEIMFIYSNLLCNFVTCCSLFKLLTLHVVNSVTFVACALNMNADTLSCMHARAHLKG